MPDIVPDLKKPMAKKSETQAEIPIYRNPSTKNFILFAGGFFAGVFITILFLIAVKIILS